MSAVERESIRRVHTDDRDAVERFLRARLVHSMFLLSNLRTAGLADHGARLQGSYVARWDRGEVVGVAAHYRMGNLMLNAPHDALALARAALADSGRPVAGVVGPEDQADAVTRGLGLDEGAAYCDERETLYRLELSQLVVPTALAEGTVRGRPLAPDDVPTVTRWSVRYRVESIGVAETDAVRAKADAHVRKNLGGDDLFVLEHEGRLVSQTGFNARVAEAVQIGGVWTPHELRGRGYARCAVASHLLAARAAGVHTAILFTGDRNLPARRAYEALGFEPVGRYRIVLFQNPAVEV